MSNPASAISEERQAPPSVPTGSKVSKAVVVGRLAMALLVMCVGSIPATGPAFLVVEGRSGDSLTRLAYLHLVVFPFAVFGAAMCLPGFLIALALTAYRQWLGIVFGCLGAAVTLGWLVQLPPHQEGMDEFLQGGIGGPIVGGLLLLPWAATILNNPMARQLLRMAVALLAAWTAFALGFAVLYLALRGILPPIGAIVDPLTDILLTPAGIATAFLLGFIGYLVLLDRRSTLWSTLALFAPCTWLIFPRLFSQHPWQDDVLLIGGTITGLAASLWVLRRLRRWLAPPRPLDCPHCHYDLRGSLQSEGQQCPECGWFMTDPWKQQAQMTPRRAVDL